MLFRSSMHSVRPVTTGGAPRRAGAGGLAETTDRCDTATWSVQVTGSKSHTFQLILVAQAQPAPRLDLITLPSKPSAGSSTSAHGGAWTTDPHHPVSPVTPFFTLSPINPSESVTGQSQLVTASKINTPAFSRNPSHFVVITVPWSQKSTHRNSSNM